MTYLFQKKMDKLLFRVTEKRKGEPTFSTHEFVAANEVLTQ